MVRFIMGLVTLVTVLVVIIDQSVGLNSDSSFPFGYQRYRRRHISNPPCTNGIIGDEENSSEFEAKIRETEFVFTGKVISQITASENRNPLKKNKESEEDAPKFWVAVKRILKGELPSSVIKDDDLKNLKQTTVKIRTVGKPKTPRNCYKRPLRIHHTAIFLAKKVQDSASAGDVILQLSADPMPLTLRNLDKVNAAVKDMTYKPRPPIIEEACETTNCAYGATCVQTSDGRAECQCPSECPQTFTPVCGTDGVTYTNHCIMKLKSCSQKKYIRIDHVGECDPRSPKPRRRG